MKTMEEKKKKSSLHVRMNKILTSHSVKAKANTNNQIHSPVLPFQVLKFPVQCRTREEKIKKKSKNPGDHLQRRIQPNAGQEKRHISP